MAISSITGLTNELTVEMADGDYIVLDDISVPSAGETKKQKYGTTKSFLLKTNEARTMTAGGLTVNDGIKIKMGTDGDLEFYHSDPISYISNTKTSGKIHIQATNAVPALVDMLILDPTGPTIAVGAANIARENNATHGIDFDASGNTQIKKELETIGKIRLGENIDIGPHRISGDGSDSGLSMIGAAALFSAGVTITGDLEMLGDIDLGSQHISGDGANHGLVFTAGDNANFTGNLDVAGSYLAGGTQGRTDSRTYVSDLRLNGPNTEFQTETVTWTSGIVTGLLTPPTWNVIT